MKNAKSSLSYFDRTRLIEHDHKEVVDEFIKKILNNI